MAFIVDICDIGIYDIKTVFARRRTGFFDAKEAHHELNRIVWREADDKHKSILNPTVAKLDVGKARQALTKIRS